MAFIWQDSFLEVPVAEERALSERVFGDPDVIGVLKSAFDFGLSRNAPWDVSQLSEGLQRSVSAAAKVYKRGVPILTDVESHQVNLRSQTVLFAGKIDDCFQNIARRDVVVVDQNVAKYWWPYLPQDFLSFEFSEADKDLNAVAMVMAQLRTRLRTGSVIHVVGGGVTGDVVGFAAGLLGAQCRYIPTTLLAMVDSSIGGKVGVNFGPWGKNQVGMFHAPESVRVWNGWLESLDYTELKSGLSEALKHAILAGDMGLWSALVEIGEDDGWDKIGALLPRIIAFKQAVVARDPFERSERAILNFGHTLGHGLETLAHQRGHHLTHGECVAIGMFHDLRLSAKRLGSSTADYLRDLKIAGVMPNRDRLRSVFGDSDQFSAAYRDVMLKILCGDKKSKVRGKVPFVLLSQPGSVWRSLDGGWTCDLDSEEAWFEIEETWRHLDC